MAQEVQQLTQRRIYFDNRKSYVIGRLPKERYRVIDTKGRTPAEKKFLDAFVRIFLAVSDGDLHKCQAIVEKEKFSDVDAYSVGKFVKGNNEPFDFVSPRQMAELKGYKIITDYFASKFGVFPEPSKKNTPVNPEDIDNYNYYKNMIEEYVEKGVDACIILNMIRAALLSTYSNEERTEKASWIEESNAFVLFQLLLTRCGENFTSKSSLNPQHRIELCAYRDCLAEGILPMEAEIENDDDYE